MNTLEQTMPERNDETDTGIRASPSCDTQTLPKGNNYVKQKVAVVFGYVGEKYSGLQYNYDPKHPTIEAELMKAIHRAGLISDANMANPREMMSKVQFERASRTDKGVHALKNICSLKVQVPKFLDSEDITNNMNGVNDAFTSNGLREMKEANNDLPRLLAMKNKGNAIMHEVTMKINRHLPTEDILVYKVHPVTGSFNSYGVCSGRRYQYYLPTFALANKDEFDQLIPIELGPEFISDEGPECNSEANADGDGRSKRPKSDRARRCEESAGDDELAREAMKLFRDIPQSAMKKIGTYRISDENLNRARELFKLYEGTHSFHNFTPGGVSSDPSNVRYMKKIIIHSPEVLIPNLEKPNFAHLDSKYYTTRDNEGSVKETEAFSETNEDQPSASKVRKVETSASVSTTRGEVSATAFSLHETLDTTIAVNRYLDDATNIEKQKENERHLNDTYIDGIEWVRIEIEGQSFILNQIRKMVGVVISCMTLGLPNEFVHHCLSPKIRIGIPTAPANGLFLSFLDIERYNSRLNRIKTQEGVSTDKEPLEIEGETKTLGKEELKDVLKKNGFFSSISQDLKSVEGQSVEAKYDAVIEAELRRYEEERLALSAAVEGMHKRIVATVCRKEACEDITGRWLRSLRQVARLCFRLSFTKGVRYVAPHLERQQNENISKYAEGIESATPEGEREIIVCFNVLADKYVPSQPLTWEKYVAVCAPRNQAVENTQPQSQ